MTVECVEGLQREFTEEDGGRELEGNARGRMCNKSRIASYKETFVSKL